MNLKCISSAEFSIIINGEKRGRFRLGRGLRQGNPLSPYLFLIVTEGLEVGLGRVEALGCTKLLVESDCQVAINFLSKKIKVYKEVEARVEHIWSLAAHPREISFHFIPRKINRVAHEIARFVVFSKACDTWIERIPSWICCWVELDHSKLAQVA